MDHGNAPTLQSGNATLHAPVSELPGPQLEDLIRTDRYDAGALIGKGGMGEVRQCKDIRLNRHIALKTATTRNKAELARFIREAQVQGQLEHPSIVPVYELGVGADGAPYFAMKRVRGESLLEVLTQLAATNTDFAARFPRRKLMQAFLSVCQAVDYAHTNGWLHRDLKPANIMLGDFGEVYVLDWGLARRIDSKEDDRTSDTAIVAPVGLTTPGSLMGTPGYMSPEQVIGGPIDARSDVYALGAILFEVLTHEMLAKGASTMELLINTRDGVDLRVRTRAPHADVPPELEKIIAKACALKVADRYASVRELHDAVDRVLAGERDLELRSSLAKHHAEAAETADAKSKSEPAAELLHRKTALREVGLALALDPAYRPAVTKLVELMQSPPKTTPPEAQAELEVQETAGVRSGSRTAGLGFLFVSLMMFVLWPFCAYSPFAFASGALFAAAAAKSLWVGWKSKNPRGVDALGSLVLSNLAIMSLFFLDGPLTVLPAFAAANTLAFRIALGREWKRLVVGLGIFTVVAPIVGSMMGWLPETFRFANGGLLLVPVAVPFSAMHTVPMLLVTFVGTIGIASIVVGRVRDSNTELARVRAMQSWNLQQLLPPEASVPKVAPIVQEGPACAIERVTAALHGT